MNKCLCGLHPKSRLHQHLTAQHLYAGAMIGVRRQIQSLIRGDTDLSISDKGPYEQHVMGAIGELAYSKMMSVPWPASVDRFRDEPDVWGVEVKDTAVWDEPHLIVRRHESTAHPYALVCGSGLIFEIRGWLWGREIKQEKYWKKGKRNNYAYWVPQSALNHEYDELKIWMTKDERNRFRMR